MPEEVEKAARKELKRLERMPEAAGEYSMVRTYLEWLIELPWKPAPEAPIDIAEARRILDADHYGLEKVKKRILEYLAVRKLNPNGRSPILCFVGPPGVGKTSLGQSIAKATGRTFARVSLGGVHDEAEIRGHRRTYIGALPGNIIQNMRKAGTRHAVMMLDEVDKLGAGGFHGDPASALLEVLDPEQNSTFRDNYLAVPYDLSQVMFLCTANVLDTIPGRCATAWRSCSCPATRRRRSSRSRSATSCRASSKRPVSRSRTARSATTCCARSSTTTRARPACATSSARSAACSATPRCASPSRTSATARSRSHELPGILGPRRFEAEVAMRTDIPGVATGLAWTPVGGDILFVEAARSPGRAS
jgi:ATP-dependent Lon protease